ncbi:MAG: hypothetical protein ACPGJV_02835 [Bacteriovoracaceae bacterium]
MRLIIYTFLIFSCFINRLNSATIGYGYSYVMTDRQEFVYMGFLMGLKQHLNRPLGENSLFLKKSTAKNMMKPFHIAMELQKNADPFIVGFATSHEALMAAKAIKGKKKIFISAVAKSSELSKFGENVFSINSSNEDTTLVALNLVKKKLNLNNGIMITNPHNAFSSNLDSLYRKELKALEGLNVQTLFTDQMGNVDIKQLKYIVEQGAQFIIVNTYIRRSFGILEGLRKINKNLPLITNSSWVIDDIEEVKRLVTDKSLDIYSFEVIDRTTKEYSHLSKLAKSEYGTTPVPHMVYGYDLGVVVADLINRTKGKLSYENILMEIKKNSCFKMTSSGGLCLPKEGGNAIREVFIVKFSKGKGFIKVSE